MTFYNIIYYIIVFHLNLRGYIMEAPKIAYSEILRRVSNEDGYSLSKLKEVYIEGHKNCKKNMCSLTAMCFLLLRKHVVRIHVKKYGYKLNILQKRFLLKGDFNIEINMEDLFDFISRNSIFVLNIEIIKIIKTKYFLQIERMRLYEKVISYIDLLSQNDYVFSEKEEEEMGKLFKSLWFLIFS